MMVIEADMGVTKMFQLKTALVSVSLAFVLGFPQIAEATPVFQQISPTPKDYLFAVNGDFTQYPGSAIGDVMGLVEAVGLADRAGSGCEIDPCKMAIGRACLRSGRR